MQIQAQTSNKHPQPLSPQKPQATQPKGGDRVEIGRRETHGEGFKMISGFCSGAVCAGVLSMVGGAIGPNAQAAGFAVGGIFGAIMGYCCA